MHAGENVPAPPGGAGRDRGVARERDYAGEEQFSGRGAGGSAKVKDANTKERKFEDVVKSAEQAAVLVY